MTEFEKLNKEYKKLEYRDNITKALLQDWVNKKSHERFFYYPDIFRALCGLHGIDCTQLPDINEEEFRQGCEDYTQELFHRELGEAGA